MDWLHYVPSLLWAGLVGLGGVLLYRARQKIRQGIESWWAHILGGLGFHLRRIIARPVAANLSAWEHAARQLRGPSQFLRVPGRSTDAPQVKTDQVFVPLTLEGGAWEYDHTSILTLGPRIRIIGDPGSGKSTILKKIFRDECRKLMHLRLRLSARLPILYELKNLTIPEDVPNGDLGGWFLERIRGDVDQVRSYKMAHCVDAYLAAGSVLVLLDGADEIISEQYPRCELAILGLCKELRSLSEKSIVCITMRSQFHKQVGAAYDGEFENPVHVKPFSPTDIYRFLMNWEFKTERRSNVTRIFADLTDRPNLREMCRNPLILSMYVAEDQTGLADESPAQANRPVPDSRTAFYRQVVEELLIRRREYQLGPLTARTKVREQRLRILGRLAFDHLLDPSEPANLLRWSDGLKVTAEVLGIDPETEAEAAFRGLARDTGLVNEERVGERFRFIHLTFCEFFTALEAIEGRADGWNSLLSAHEVLSTQGHRARLNEVLPFAAALAPLHARDAIMQDFAGFPESAVALTMFLETKHYEHPLWQTLLDERCDQMVTSLGNHPNLEILQEFYLLSVCIRDAESHGVKFRWHGMSFDDYVTNVVTGADRSGSLILDVMAETDPFACLRIAQLCGIDLIHDRSELVLRNADQTAFLAMIIDFMENNPNKSTRAAQILFLSGMRSPLVHAELMMAKPMESWNHLLKEIPNHRRWIKVIGSRSLWTDVLDRVYQQPLSSNALSISFFHLPSPKISQMQFAIIHAATIWGGLIGSSIAVTFFLIVSLLYTYASAKHTNMWWTVIPPNLGVLSFVVLLVGILLSGVSYYHGVMNFRYVLRRDYDTIIEWKHHLSFICDGPKWVKPAKLHEFMKAWLDHTMVGSSIQESSGDTGNDKPPALG